jgi:hypothetical protein
MIGGIGKCIQGSGAGGQGSVRGNQISKIKLQKYKLKIKYSCRRQREITDAGLILFGGRFLDCAGVLSKESTAAALEMTFLF